VNVHPQKQPQDYRIHLPPTLTLLRAILGVHFALGPHVTKYAKRQKSQFDETEPNSRARARYGRDTGMIRLEI
jgi:hypothetical protein